MTHKVKASLHIGINKFDGGFSPLSGCVNDARDCADRARSLGYWTSTITDKQATRERVLHEVRELARGAKDWGDESRILITASSHGTQVADENGDENDRKDEAFCCADLAFDAAGRASGLITDDEWNEEFARFPASCSLVVLFDCCHSGTMNKAILPWRPRFIANPTVPTVRLKPRPRFLFVSPKTGRRPITRVVISACRAGDVAADAVINGKWQGAATAAWLTQASSGMPTGLTAWRELTRQMRHWTSSRGYPQVAQLEAW